MPESPSKFYVTTPIYYVNARPHIGHAYTTIVADVLARRHRLLGDDTWFLTGTDEHGQKIERSAAAANIPPQQFADQVSAEFRTLWDRMGLTYNQYIRTTDAAHKRGVQKLFSTLYENGQIYLSSYTGQYCIGEEMFVDGPPGTIGPDGKPTETVTEENFFFRLSEYQLPLLDLIESDTLTITSEARKNEVLSFLRGKQEYLAKVTRAARDKALFDSNLPEGHRGPIEVANTSFEESVAEASLPRSAAGHAYVPGALKDLSISRSSFTWGIPVPEPAASLTKDPHIIYVWLDALANYMTAVGYGDDSPEAQAKFSKYWPADLHLVGKEIIRFHCVYWPAFLLALNPAAAREPRPANESGAPRLASETWAEAPKLTPPDHKLWAKKMLPQAIAAHGWLLFDDSKMSKSKGNIVRTETILEAFGTLCPPPPQTPEADASLKGTASAVPPTHPEQAALAAEALSPSPHQRDLFAADVLRYFLLREIPFGQDGSFTFNALITRYNADLANGYGNLVSRTLNLVVQHFSFGYVYGRPSGSARFMAISSDDAEARKPFDPSLKAAAENTVSTFNEAVSHNDFSRAIEQVSNLIAATDGFVSTTAPWKLLRELTTANARDNTESLTAQHGEATVRLERLLYTAAESIRIITALLYPILPYATAFVWRQLGLGDIEESALNGELKNLQWGGLKPGTKLGPLSPLFPRADTSPDKGLAHLMSDIEAHKTQQAAQTKLNPPMGSNASANDTESQAPDNTSHPGAPPRTGELSEPNPGAQVGGSAAITTERAPTPSHTEAPASGIFAGQTAQAADSHHPPDASPQITIEDFAKVELRVAKVLVCERIPKADKLLRLEVDLGYETRQILSGIAEWYTPEDLIGRRIVVITNLAPRKMRGLESHGMLLAASASEGGKPALATFLDSDELPLGSRLK